jgi:glutathione S-transferase
MLRLVDAPGCPYCARVRIVLAEKTIAHERVVVDLGRRPGWLYALNPTGRVPVLEGESGPLPESVAIMEYLEELRGTDALLPDGRAARAQVRSWICQHPARFADAYYAWRRREGTREEVQERLDQLDRQLFDKDYLVADRYTLADIAYVPWILRAETLFGFELPPAVARWVRRLARRPAIAAEVEVVAGLDIEPS